MYICFCVNVTSVTLQTWLDLLHEKYLSEIKSLIFLLNFYVRNPISIDKPIWWPYSYRSVYAYVTVRDVCFAIDTGSRTRHLYC